VEVDNTKVGDVSWAGLVVIMGSIGLTNTATANKAAINLGGLANVDL
jgi:hypothetical protein